MKTQLLLTTWRTYLTLMKFDGFDNRNHYDHQNHQSFTILQSRALTTKTYNTFNQQSHNQNLLFVLVRLFTVLSSRLTTNHLNTSQPLISDLTLGMLGISSLQQQHITATGSGTRYLVSSYDADAD